MIVSVESFVRGFARYIREEVLPKYPDDSFLRFGLGIYVDAVIYKPDGIISKVENNPVFRSSMEDGQIDTDLLFKLAKDNMTEKGIAISLPFGGIIRFNREDATKIKESIERD